MRAVRRSNATGAFSWIGSDGWSARNLVSDGNEAEVEGTLSVQPQANPVRGFEEYFLNLTADSNRRNPWFIGKYSPYPCFTYVSSLTISLSRVTNVSSWVLLLSVCYIFLSVNTAFIHVFSIFHGRSHSNLNCGICRWPCTTGWGRNGVKGVVDWLKLEDAIGMEMNVERN